MSAQPTPTLWIPNASAFRRAVAEIVRIDVADVHDDSLLVDDLGFDSMSLVELLATIEELFGVGAPIPDLDDDWSSFTVAGVYTAVASGVATRGIR